MIFAHFDDEDDIDGDPPMGERLAPVEPLEIYDTLPAFGEWSLKIHSASQDSGILHSWALHFSVEPCQVR